MYIYLTILDERFYSIPSIKAYLLYLTVLVVLNMLLFQSINEEKLIRVQQFGILN